jgi:hypothetical protein
MGGLQGTSTICHPIHPYIRGALSLKTIPLVSNRCSLGWSFIRGSTVLPLALISLTQLNVVNKIDICTFRLITTHLKILYSVLVIESPIRYPTPIDQ